MSDRRQVAVTGATGFLGSHITERLIQDGYRVRILARDRAKASPFEGRVENIVVADICERPAIDTLVEGADAVIQLVSNFRSASGPPESYRHINLDGSRTVLEACEAAGVKRLVHCSTIGVHGHVQSTPANEDSPYNPGDLYQETKRDTELLIRERLPSLNTEVVVIRPCSLYGPGDTRMLKMFRMLAKRRFLMLGPCQENFHAVYIDDVVEGFMKALTTEGIGGETFILGGPRYLPLREYVNLAAEAVGASPPWINLPYGPFYAAAVACEAVCVPLGIEPPLHRRRVRFYKNNRAFDIGKARRMLGYEPRIDLDEGMARTVAWYREQALLPAASA